MKENIRKSIFYSLNQIILWALPQILQLFDISPNYYNTVNIISFLLTSGISGISNSIIFIYLTYK
jgi:hypothetical protein